MMRRRGARLGEAGLALTNPPVQIFSAVGRLVVFFSPPPVLQPLALPDQTAANRLSAAPPVAPPYPLPYTYLNQTSNLLVGSY